MPACCREPGCGLRGCEEQLAIETDEGVSKAAMGGHRDLPEIRQFVRIVSWSFGYEIDTSALDGRSS